MKTSCPFCQIARHELDQHTIWEDENFIAFLDKNPKKDGHTLLIPKIHIENFFELDDDLYTKFFLTAKFLSAAIQAAMASKRVGMVIEGFGVAHLHAHLIPIRRSGDLHPARKASRSKAHKVEIAERIRKEIFSSAAVIPAQAGIHNTQF